MPTYEYRCENSHCGHQFEMMQKMSEEPLKHCPVCQKDSLIKLISAAAFHLKGEGWYKTDYKSPSKSQSEPDNAKESNHKNPEAKKTEINSSHSDSDKNTQSGSPSVSDSSLNRQNRQKTSRASSSDSAHAAASDIKPASKTVSEGK